LGDAVHGEVLVKALTEGTWHYHIARLGAPFGMDAIDFPIGCSLDFAVIKILTAIVHNPFLSVNLYWLLTIVMASAFAALFFRSLQISHLVSVSFATLFAISPFVFYRNVGHWELVQFIVPAAAYLGIVLARWQIDPETGKLVPLRTCKRGGNPHYLSGFRWSWTLSGVSKVTCT
jgi:hypothetical protein